MRSSLFWIFITLLQKKNCEGEWTQLSCLYHLHSTAMAAAEVLPCSRSRTDTLLRGESLSRRFHTLFRLNEEQQQQNKWAQSCAFEAAFIFSLSRLFFLLLKRIVRSRRGVTWEVDASYLRSLLVQDAVWFLESGSKTNSGNLPTLSLPIKWKHARIKQNNVLIKNFATIKNRLIFLRGSLLTFLFLYFFLKEKIRKKENQEEIKIKIQG